MECLVKTPKGWRIASSWFAFACLLCLLYPYRNDPDLPGWLTGIFK